jgi:hypothetical protein
VRALISLRLEKSVIADRECTPGRRLGTLVVDALHTMLMRRETSRCGASEPDITRYLLLPRVLRPFRRQAPDSHSELAWTVSERGGCETNAALSRQAEIWFISSVAEAIRILRYEGSRYSPR